MFRKYSARTILTVLSLLFVISSISISDARECTIKIIQDGREIIPSIENKISTYRLKADEFKIEVNDLYCGPGIFPIKDSRHIEYLQRTPLIFSSGGYGLAENLDSIDVFGPNGGEDPSTTIDQVIETATPDIEWAKRKYKELCSELKYCPTPANPYSRHLPFTDPETRKARNYADFKRWIPSSPMSAATGLKCQMVIYTTIDSITSPGRKFALFDIIKPNIIVLDFQPVSYKFLLIEAKKGDAKSQYILGLMYYTGRGVLQNYKEAFRWIKKAADQGHALAQYNLGSMYELGQGITRDHREAQRLFKMAAEKGNSTSQNNPILHDIKKAAEQGNAKAQMALGSLYENGQGVTRDFKEAVMWYKMAVKQNAASAKCNLAKMYSKGLGVAKDLNEAKRLAKEGYEQGEEYCKKVLEEYDIEK